MKDKVKAKALLKCYKRNAKNFSASQKTLRIQIKELLNKPEMSSSEFSRLAFGD